MKNFFVFAFIISFVSSSFGHGENKPGPNGGIIRMPGNYHTEVISVERNILKVYLLDIQFKNPTTKKSSVEMALTNKVKAKCEPKEEFFICNFPENIDLTKKGSLKVTSVREEQKGMVVDYPLPLSFEKEVDAHSGHH